MGQFGWAFIKGQSIQGTNNGLLVKTGDTEATGQSALTWDATNQTMTVTAANASTINDGAAACLIMSEEMARKLNLSPIARILDYASHSQDPEWFTTAPVS